MERWFLRDDNLFNLFIMMNPYSDEGANRKLYQYNIESRSQDNFRGKEELKIFQSIGYFSNIEAALKAVMEGEKITSFIDYTHPIMLKRQKLINEWLSTITTPTSCIFGRNSY